MPDSVLVGSCQSPNAQVFLEPGNVRARILNDGSLFLGAGGSDVGYEVPKGSGKHAIYTSNLWIAGYVSHELRAAAGTFFVQEYWPGPIDSEGRPPTDCVEYDHVWSVTLDDLEQHASGSATSTDIADWPADLGAPYENVNGVAGYQPDEGDRPSIRGDQMTWWIMNDRGNEHTRTGTLPLGVEVRVAAWAFADPGLLGNTTFYQFTIVNRNDDTLTDTYVGLWSDTDVGFSKNDAVGTDTTLGIAYAFNGSPDDGGLPGEYGMTPPAIGVMPLPLDEPEGKARLRFDHTMWALNGAGNAGDARSGEHSTITSGRAGKTGRR